MHVFELSKTYPGRHTQLSALHIGVQGLGSKLVQVGWHWSSPHDENIAFDEHWRVAKIRLQLNSAIT